MATITEYPNVPKAYSSVPLLLVVMPWCVQTGSWKEELVAIVRTHAQPVEVVPFFTEHGKLPAQASEWVGKILSLTDTRSDVAAVVWIPSGLSEAPCYMPLVILASNFQARCLKLVVGTEKKLPCSDTLCEFWGQIDALGMGHVPILDTLGAAIREGLALATR